MAHFKAVITIHMPNGRIDKVVQRFGLTPEESRRMYNLALIGYDPHCELGPGDVSLKFMSPVALEALKEKEK